MNQAYSEPQMVARCQRISHCIAWLLLAVSDEVCNNIAEGGSMEYEKIQWWGKRLILEDLLEALFHINNLPMEDAALCDLKLHRSTSYSE